MKIKRNKPNKGYLMTNLDLLKNVQPFGKSGEGVQKTTPLG